MQKVLIQKGAASHLQTAGVRSFLCQPFRQSVQLHYERSLEGSRPFPGNPDFPTLPFAANEESGKPLGKSDQKQCSQAKIHVPNRINPNGKTEEQTFGKYPQSELVRDSISIWEDEKRPGFAPATTIPRAPQEETNPPRNHHSIQNQPQDQFSRPTVWSPLGGFLAGHGIFSSIADHNRPDLWRG